jgi:dTDP-4-amino-4,6-dideoxygalactose transaminase
MSFYKHSPELIKIITDMIRRDRLSIVSGSYLKLFETAIADFWGNRYGMAFANGTGAIHSALFALDVHLGDEVIVPTYGFHAMVIPILLLGATPVFCDISFSTLCLEVEHVEKVKTSKTKGILLLHPWGNVADMNNLRAYADKNNLFILSDASHAHGACFGGQPIGKYSEITCVSYGKDKLISGGELGGATTDSDQLWDRMALFSQVNRIPADLQTSTYKYMSNSIGPKYRPHALSLPIALDQLNSYSERILKLNININKFCSYLKSTRIFEIQKVYPDVSRVYWKIVVFINHKNPLKVNKFILETAKSMSLVIEQDHYSPLLHQDPIYKEYYNISSCNNSLPNAESLKNKIVQIHAPILDDENFVYKYCELFKTVENKL